MLLERATSLYGCLHTTCLLSYLTACEPGVPDGLYLPWNIVALPADLFTLPACQSRSQTALLPMAGCETCLPSAVGLSACLSGLAVWSSRLRTFLPSYHVGDL
eukprot:gene5118-biopygen833